MSDYATKQDVKDIVESAVAELSEVVDAKITKAVDDLSGIIADLAQSMHDQVLELKRADAEIKTSMDRLVNTIDGFLSRIDSYETEMAARDHQFEKLLVWARKVSEKTGIPLENL